MQNLTPEMLMLAKACKTPEELITLAKEQGIELTSEQATEYCAQINQTGEISDDELDNVAGGCQGARDFFNLGQKKSEWRCPDCGVGHEHITFRSTDRTDHYTCKNCGRKWDDVKW